MLQTIIVAGEARAKEIVKIFTFFVTVFAINFSFLYKKEERKGCRWQPLLSFHLIISCPDAYP